MGYQLSLQRVLAEMRDVGLAATELGPEGFLPSDPDELSALLDSYGLSCVGTFARSCCTTPGTIRCQTWQADSTLWWRAGQRSRACRVDRH